MPALRILSAVVVAATACGGAGTAVDTGDVTGFRMSTVSLDGEPLLVAVAAEPADRRQGLRGVSDLGDLDGMLFVFPEPTTTSFTMQGVPIHLDVGFFDEKGDLLEVRSMSPCEEAPCPSYPTPRGISAALERPRGGFEGVPPDAVLVFDLP